MLVTPFFLSEEEVECPELRSAGYSTTPCTTYVTERSVIKDGGNKSLQKACKPPTRLYGVTARKRAIEIILSVNIIPDTGTLDFVFNY